MDFTLHIPRALLIIITIVGWPIALALIGPFARREEAEVKNHDTCCSWMRRLLMMALWASISASTILLFQMEKNVRMGYLVCAATQVLFGVIYLVNGPPEPPDHRIIASAKLDLTKLTA